MAFDITHRSRTNQQFWITSNKNSNPKAIIINPTPKRNKYITITINSKHSNAGRRKMLRAAKSNRIKYFHLPPIRRRIKPMYISKHCRSITLLTGYVAFIHANYLPKQLNFLKNSSVTQGSSNINNKYWSV
jgi:hypothetical protein